MSCCTSPPPHENCTLQQKSQIGWIFKSKAYETYCLYDSGPRIRYYALNYGFHMFLNLLTKPLRERHVALFVYKCLTFDLSRDLSEISLSVYIVTCQRGGVSDEPPWLRAATDQGPFSLLTGGLYLMRDYLKFKNTDQHWACFTKAG